MTERSTGRNGNDRSSRLRGVLARIVSLARHYPADRSVIQAGAAVAEVPIAIGGWGGHFFRRKCFVYHGFWLILWHQNNFVKITLFILYFLHEGTSLRNGVLFSCYHQWCNPKVNFTIGAIAPRSESRRRADQSGGEWAVTDLMTDGRRPYHGIDGPAAGFALGDRAQ